MTTTRLFLTLTLGFLSTMLHAQADWQWGISGGSFTDIPNSENVESMATDQDGNVFFVASVGPNNLKLDGMPQNFYGNNFMVNQLIGSYDCEGNYRWSRTLGGNEINKFTLNNIKTDSFGNVYLSGMLSRSNANATHEIFGGIGFGATPDTILPNSHSSVNLNKQRLFIVKYNSLGVMQWLKFPQATDVPNSNGSLSRGLDVDPTTGNSYFLTRLFQGLYCDGNFEVSANNDQKFFVLEYDTNGNFVSGTLMDFEINTISGYKFKRNHQTGRYYLGGRSTTTNAFVVNGENYTGSIMACFDADGSFLWKEHAVGLVAIQDFSIDEEDHSVYITGSIRHTQTFFGISPTPEVNDHAPMLFKINEDGQLIWHQIATGGFGRAPSAVTVMNEEVTLLGWCAILDWQGYTIVPPQGNGGDDIYILRFNKYTAQIFDLKTIDSNLGNNEIASTIAAGPFGNYYAGGRFTQFMYIGDDTLLNGAPGTDFFVAKYGTENCNCALPTASFTIEEASNGYQFTFTGTTEESTVVWDFGDENSSEDMNPVHSYATSGNYQVCATVTDVCGSTQFCTTIEATLSHSNPDFAQVRVYPNPTSSQLNIQSPEALQYEIYNLVGRSIQSGAISVGTTTLNVSEFPAGMYLLMLTQSDGARSSLKFVKME